MTRMHPMEKVAKAAQVERVAMAAQAEMVGMAAQVVEKAAMEMGMVLVDRHLESCAAPECSCKHLVS